MNIVLLRLLTCVPNVMHESRCNVASMIGSRLPNRLPESIGSIYQPLRLRCGAEHVSDTAFRMLDQNTVTARHVCSAVRRKRPCLSQGRFRAQWNVNDLNSPPAHSMLLMPRCEVGTGPIIDQRLGGHMVRAQQATTVVLRQWGPASIAAWLNFASLSGPFATPCRAVTAPKPFNNLSTLFTSVSLFCLSCSYPLIVITTATFSRFYDLSRRPESLTSRSY
jgi:hypothetical protein